MFDLQDAKTGRTAARRFQKTVLGVCAAMLVSAPSMSSAQMSKECDVSFSVTNMTDDLYALQFEASSAVGAFKAPAACTVDLAGNTEINADTTEGAKVLNVAFADTTPFSTASPPVAVATCTFVVQDSAHSLVAGDVAVNLLDASESEFGDPADPAPTVGVSIGACGPAIAYECGNGVTQGTEECDDGNAALGDGCHTGCYETGSCPAAPLTGCLETTGDKGAQIKLLDKSPDTKDKGQFAVKKAEATELEDLKDPVNDDVLYTWCVFDDGDLVMGEDVPSGGTCGTKPCWKATGTKGFLFKGDGTIGVGQIKLKTGATGKAQVQVKAGSKLGSFDVHGLQVTGDVDSQLVIDDGDEQVCFTGTFTAPSKSDASKYIAKSAL